MLAMHMANELLSPGVAIAFMVGVAGLLALASWRTQRDFDPSRVPLMGVMGAFVFAAQMINFPLVAVPVSGHLGGGVLLAILLGPHAATLVMASILIVQCLIFQDGGLLALGTNIFNLGVVPCYLGYFLFSRIAGKKPKSRRLYLATFAATMIGMLAGAAMVPVQVTLSGVAKLPFGEFMLVIVGIHLLVALGEAIITFLVIGYLARVRPASLGTVADRLGPASAGVSSRAVLVSLAVVALLLAGVVSRFASKLPDALEWRTSIEEAGAAAVVVENPSEVVAEISGWQERTSPLPDYKWTSLSGLLGTVVTLILVALIGMALKRRRASAAASSHPV